MTIERSDELQVRSRRSRKLEVDTEAEDHVNCPGKGVNPRLGLEDNGGELEWSNLERGGASVIKQGARRSKLEQ